MKLLESLKRKLNNTGSSIVMVIVALSFIGIIVGSLLTAAGAAYKLKRQELNAKDNFYYVEQAMQEIYTGVGMQTVEEMKSAYAYTVENMVYFDLDLGTYKTLDDAKANEIFKKEFMNRIMSSDYFKQGADALADILQGYVSNSSVKVDASRLSIERNTDSIILKNVTVTRNHEYSTSAGGDYTQTISADIVISEPDFEVAFNTLNADYSAIFDFAMIADMGVEVRKTPANPGLSITGNVYAASDYYNKTYNKGFAEIKELAKGKDGKPVEAGLSYKDGVISGTVLNEDTGETKEYSYKFNAVTNKNLDKKKIEDEGYVNAWAEDPKVSGTAAPFDGENSHSRYSGFYIDGAKVSIMADTMIIPGSIAVMNKADLVVYGKGGASTLPQIWADDIVLGGTSQYNKDDKIYEGSSATFRADVFVKDDTALDADGSSLTIAGSYYGYGDGTSADARVFYDTVADIDKDGVKDYFQIKDGDKVYNRGHFNSSAIVINGQNASLDFSNLNNMYIAGRAYVEFSRYGTEKVTDEDVKTGNTTSKEQIKTTTYTFEPSYTTTDNKTNYVRDYKTGESIAYKTSQLIYNVSTWETAPVDVARGYDAVVIPQKLNVNNIGVPYNPNLSEDIVLEISGTSEKVARIRCMANFFPETLFHGYVPVTKTVVKNKEYVFIDFDKAWSIITEANKSSSNTEKAAAQSVITAFSNAEQYKRAYAAAYFVWAAQDDAPVELTQLLKFEDFEYGDASYTVNKINVTAIDAKNVYSSGAISVSKGNTFLMTTVADEDAISEMLSDVTYNPMAAVENKEGTVVEAFNFSNDIEMEYNFMKWNLAHYKSGSESESKYIKDVISQYGEDVITPINKYLNFDNITHANAIDGKVLSDGAIDYRIWVSETDVTLDEDAELVGIVVAKGDVYFSDDVRSFTGIIISGGKVYVGDNVTSITAAPATCREILRQCMRKSNDDDCKNFLNLFKEYEGSIDPDPTVKDSVSPMVSIDSIGFSDIVSMVNWTNTLGGAYGVTE